MTKQILLAVTLFFAMRFSSALGCMFPFGVTPTVYVQEWWQKNASGNQLSYVLQNRHFESLNLEADLLELTGFETNCTPIFKTISNVISSRKLAKGEVVLARANVELPPRCESEVLCLVRVKDVERRVDLGFMHAPRSPVVGALVEGARVTCAGANVGGMGCVLGVVEPEYLSAESGDAKFSGKIRVQLKLEHGMAYRVSKVAELADALKVVSVVSGSDEFVVSEDDMAFNIRVRDETAGGDNNQAFRKIELRVENFSFDGIKHFVAQVCLVNADGVCLGNGVSESVLSYFLVNGRL